MIERRITYKLNDTPPPDGWRYCVGFFRKDETMDKLYTNAPSNIGPYRDPYEHVFVNYRPVWQTREVTEWVDEDDSVTQP